MDTISVVVCTYNRSQSLQETLQSLAAQQVNGHVNYEVIVVDNNSSDGTRNVVTRAQQSFGDRLRYVFEPRQGLSHARNTGLREAAGAVVAFTDDDVRVRPDWLAGLHAAFQRYGADCVYGKILPIWMERRPEWLTDFFYGKLAILDHGEIPFVVTSDAHQFFGANFALTKEALTRLGGFNVELGRTGTTLRMGEDTELFFKLLSAGRKVVYQPEAVVLHKVPKERMTMRYFRQWHLDQGRAAAHLDTYNEGVSWLGIPRWAVRKFLGAVRRYLASFTPAGRRDRIPREMKVLYYCGLFAERQRIFWRRGRPCRS